MSHSLGGPIAAHLTDIADNWLDADGSLTEFHCIESLIPLLSANMDMDPVSVQIYPGHFSVSQVRGATRIDLPGSIAELDGLVLSNKCTYVGFSRDPEELLREQEAKRGKRDEAPWQIEPEEEQRWKMWQAFKAIASGGYQVQVPRADHQLMSTRPDIFVAVLKALRKKPERQFSGMLDELGAKLVTAKELVREFPEFSESLGVRSLRGAPRSPLVVEGGKAHACYVQSSRRGGSGDPLNCFRRGLPEIIWDSNGQFFDKRILAQQKRNRRHPTFPGSRPAGSSSQIARYLHACRELRKS